MDNAKQQAALADEFTALLTELGGMQTVSASAALTRKFDRIYTELSRIDEKRNARP